MKHVLFIICWFCLIYSNPANAQNKTIPGEITSPYPTINNLAVEWAIQGDDNENGVVTVQFRQKGETAWHQGMPLFRVPAGQNIGFSWINKQSGSIFDLKPATEYEIKLNLKDPDGGSTEKTIISRTRQVPEIGSTDEIIDLKPGRYDTLRTKSGTAEKPVVYCCTQGKATFTYIDLNNKKWVYIYGLNVENSNKAVIETQLNGPEKKLPIDNPYGLIPIGIQLNGAENCAVMGCTVNSTWGIVAYKPGATNCYISDNIVTGTNKWNNESMGAHGDNLGEGIEMTGPGNVICYNKVIGFRDCISTMEDQHVVNQTCIDIYNNDINRGLDDAIEADFCFSNCRIYSNRITNCFVGLSSQPGLGGPNYFFRNCMYNLTHGAFKLKRYSQGDIVMHNTVVKVGAGLGGNDSLDYAWFRNNLAIGGPTGGVNWGDYGAGNPYAADIIKPKEHCSFDYDAVGVSGITYTAKIGKKNFSEVEKHGTEWISLEETFTNVEFPNPPVPERAVPDLRPNPKSKVIDAGVIIPNINDNYTGAAPDCGAYEAGQELPHYGPRNLNQFLKP